MIIYFILLLTLVFFPVFFQTDLLFSNFNLPFFSIPPFWIKLFSILCGFFLFLSVVEFGKRNHFSSITSKMSNYALLSLFFQFLYFLLLFLKNHLFLASITTIFAFFSSLFLYEEISKIDEKSTRFLNPFVLWSLYLSAISITSYLLEVT